MIKKMHDLNAVLNSMLSPELRQVYITNMAEDEKNLVQMYCLVLEKKTNSLGRKKYHFQKYPAL